MEVLVQTWQALIGSVSLKIRVIQFLINVKEKSAQKIKFANLEKKYIIKGDLS